MVTLLVKSVSSKTLSDAPYPISGPEFSSGVSEELVFSFFLGISCLFRPPVSE